MGTTKLKNRLELFLDNFLVYAATFYQMVHRIKMLFIGLARYCLKLQPFKYHLFQEEVCYLGHKVSHKDIGLDDS